jgi:hypothetical protein
MYYQFKDNQLYAIPESWDYNQYAILTHLHNYQDSVLQRECLQQIFDKTRYLLAILWSIQNLVWDSLNLRNLERTPFLKEDLQQCIDVAAESSNHQVYLTLLKMKERYVAPAQDEGRFEL